MPLDLFSFKNLSKFKLIIIFLAVILLASLLVGLFSFNSKKIPDEFLTAYQNASVLAQEIVLISEETAKNLENVALLDKNKQYQKALEIISAQLKANDLAREKAIKLSYQLEKMAKTASAIEPLSLSQKVLQAIGFEAALISHLVNYNHYLVNLLELLKDKFINHKDPNGKIEQLVRKINLEIKEINNLNKKFNQLMTNLNSD